MRSVGLAAMTFLALGMVAFTAHGDEVKVSGVHNCCGACCKLIHETLGKVEGVSEASVSSQ